MKEQKETFKEWLYKLFCQFMARWQKEKDIDFYADSKNKIDEEIEKDSSVAIEVPIDKIVNEPSIEIIEETRIREKYKGLTKHSWDKKTRNNEEIKEICLHSTGGGTNSKNLINWVYNGERAKEYKWGIALFHILIGFQGEIIRIIPFENWIHCSSSGLYDKHIVNIELLKKDSKNQSVPTEEQYKSLFNLILYLMDKYPNLNRVSTHRYNINKFKKRDRVCPGTFNFERLNNFLKENGYTFKTYFENELRYEIKKND